jgi:hypothetical protein
VLRIPGLAVWRLLGLVVRTRHSEKRGAGYDRWPNRKLVGSWGPIGAGVPSRGSAGPVSAHTFASGHDLRRHASNPAPRLAGRHPIGLMSRPD